MANLNLVWEGSWAWQPQLNIYGSLSYTIILLGILALQQKFLDVIQFDFQSCWPVQFPRTVFISSHLEVKVEGQSQSHKVVLLTCITKTWIGCPADDLPNNTTLGFLFSSLYYIFVTLVRHFIPWILQTQVSTQTGLLTFIYTVFQIETLRLFTGVLQREKNKSSSKKPNFFRSLEEKTMMNKEFYERRRDLG